MLGVPVTAHMFRQKELVQSSDNVVQLLQQIHALVETLIFFFGQDGRHFQCRKTEIFALMTKLLLSAAHHSRASVAILPCLAPYAPRDCLSGDRRERDSLGHPQESTHRQPVIEPQLEWVFF